MKVLVTGGAGFIGSHIVDACIERGDDVVVFDNLLTGKRENVHPSALLIEGDIASPEFYTFVIEQKFDIIFHFAAHMELRVSVDKPVFDAHNNVIGSVNVLQAAHISGVQHVVLASTIATLGEFRYFPADDAHPTEPISPYGVSKLCMEQYASYYHRVLGLPVCCLRFTTVYGPRQNPNGESGVIAIFLQKFIKGAVATVHGDGEQTRDYLHVQDVVHACLLASEKRINGSHLVASGTENSVNTLIQLLRGYGHENAAVEYGPRKLGDPMRMVCTAHSFYHATGWKPTISFEEGVQQTTLWFRENTSA